MNDLKYWIWFSRLENLTPKTLVKLLEIYKTPKNIFYKTKEELIIEGIKEKQAEEITKREYKTSF